MCQVMNHYAWQLAFEHVKEEGPQKIVQFFKIGLNEMPRLEREFLSSTPEDRNNARKEILTLFKRIDLEMSHAMQQSKISEEEFIKEVRKSSNYTPEEQKLLTRIPELMGQHHSELFSRRAYDTPKKRSPFFKV
jgi:hypothetical protein